MSEFTRRSFIMLGGGAIATLANATISAAQDQQAPRLQFEVTKTSGGFRWRLKSGNGKVIATSGEAYKNKADCLHAIDLIKRGAATATTQEIA